MNKIAVIYGSSTGNTEAAAKMLANKLGADIFDVNTSPVDRISEYDNLIFGTSTWGIGDLQDDWEDFIDHLEDADLRGKVIALFGCGDGETYADSFVDGIGTIYETIKDKGCKVIGFTNTDGYYYDDSKAEVGGKFVGLVLDEENQGNLTESRIHLWVEDISKEFN